MLVVDLDGSVVEQLCKKGSWMRLELVLALVESDDAERRGADAAEIEMVMAEVGANKTLRVQQIQNCEDDGAGGAD